MREESASYQPALDGVRAVAVIVVLLFHAGFGWMSGGYFGVSVFFTLSGFLITRLLILEHRREGRVSLRRFYSRRVKRLMPASLLCIAAILLVRMWGSFDEVETLRRDAVGSLFQVFNWVRLSGHSSYADLFRDSNISPFEHFWSLAIEEQFYLLWPITLVGLLALTRRRRRSVTPLVTLIALACAAAAPMIGWAFGSDAAYWSTPSRFAEILLGAALAAWVTSRPRISPNAARVAAPALLAILVLCVVLPASGGPAYSGLLPLLAITSTALIFGLQAPGRVRTVLSVAPLVAIGKISYGLYLFHWPVFVLLRERGWHLDRAPGFALAISITLAVAVLSFAVVERPIRTARWPVRRTATLAATALIAASLTVVAVPGARPLIAIDEDLVKAAEIRPDTSLVSLRASPATTLADPVTTQRVTDRAASGRTDLVGATPSMANNPATTATTTTTTTTTTIATALPLPGPPPRPVRVLVTGDSTAAMLHTGLARWAVEHPTLAQVSLVWAVGGGFLQSGEPAEPDKYDERAKEVIEVELPESVGALRPDVVVLMNSFNDIRDRVWSDEEGVLTSTDERFRDRLADAYRSTTRALLDQGVPTVAWVLPPTPIAYFGNVEAGFTTRYSALRDVIRDVVDDFPDHVTVIDMEGWSQVTGNADDPDWRPDGLHLSEATSLEFSTVYLGPRLVELATEG